jgi:hypothetical protein
MSFRAHIQPILVFLCLMALVWQGCNVSSGGDGGAAGRGGGDTINLALTTANDARTIVTGGNNLVIQLTVTDNAGNGISGSEVRFTTTAGTLTADGLTESTDTTDANGVATATLTSSNTVETARVTAEVSGFSQAIRISFVSGDPASVSLSAVPNVLAPGATTTVRVVVRDANSLPVEGVTVSLSIPTNSSGGLLNPTSGTTGSSGEVLAEYTAGSLLGTDVVQGTIGTLSDTVEISVQTTKIIPTNIQLFVSPSPQLDTDKDPKGVDCAQSVTLTARVTDDSNNVIQGVEVAFSSDFGSIGVLNAATDADGLARAGLDICGDPTNRPIGDATNPPITATATAGSLEDTEEIAVTGTTVTVSGANSAVRSDTETLSLAVLLRDAAGDGIADKAINLESGLGNTLPASVTTDANGQATFDYTPVNSGTDIITARALGAIGSLNLTVSAADFRFILEDVNGNGVLDAGEDLNANNTLDNKIPAEVLLNVDQIIRIRWVGEDGSPQSNQLINFSTTRGTLTQLAPGSNTTDANGVASMVIRSDNAGRAVITASANTAGGPSSQISTEFVATNPTTLFLQAAPTTVGVNLNGVTDQKSIVTAIVRDPNGNLVKNQTVRFLLNDTTGGTIFPAQAETDSFGRASTVYTAGATPSAQDGVIIDAEVLGQIDAGCDPAADDPGGACDRVTLTVAKQQMFVVLGTGNDIVKDGELYRKPYTVLVTDVNGNPIANATVELNLYPTRYEKGFYTRFYDETGECVGWGKVRTVTPAATLFPSPDNVDQACDNEDLNRNGFLDVDLGEDVNNNGSLEPANPAAPLGTVTTNENGFGFFNVSYAREFTWVEVEIEARATVGGSEGFSTARFFLPGLASDFDDCDVAPPGLYSAYGQATSCGCDELDDPTCPVVTSLRPVQFAQVSPGDFIPAAGGTANAVEFSISGGGGVSYQVFLVGDSAGTLRTSLQDPATDPTIQVGDVINVNAGDTFFLVALPNQFTNPRTLSFYATDDTTGIFSEQEDVIQDAATDVSLTRTAGPSPVPNLGATLTFTVSGGTGSTYTVSTDVGDFDRIGGIAITPTATINVDPGVAFNLVVQQNNTGAVRTITLTAVDGLAPNLTDTLTIDQE